MMSSVEVNNNKIVFHGIPNPNHLLPTSFAFTLGDLSPEFFDYGKVEVMLDSDCPNNWYEAYIIDIEVVSNVGDDGNPCSSSCIATIVMANKNEDAEISLSLMKNVKKYPIDQIRFIPKPNSDLIVHDNEMVEVKVTDPNSFIYWKLAKVKMSKDDCIALQFVTNSNPNDASNLEVATKKETRLLNLNKPLSHEYNPFFRFLLEIPQDLMYLIQRDSSWASNYEHHRTFKKYSDLINVSINFEANSMVCLGFALANKVIIEEQVVKRAEMLSSMHFNKLNDYYWLNVSSSDKIKTYSLNPDNAFNRNEHLVKVMVDDNLIGLAIGKNGHQIQKARTLEGIKSIELDDVTKTFTITGSSKEVCLKAASLINFIEEFLNFSTDFSDFFEEKRLIQELVDKTGIHLINLSNKSDNIRLQLIGTSETVENFKIFLNFQMSEWNEIQMLKIKNQKLNQQINSSQANTIQSYPDDRRDDHSKRYNSGKYLTCDSRYNREPKNFAEVVKGGNFPEYKN